MKFFFGLEEGKNLPRKGENFGIIGRETPDDLWDLNGALKILKALPLQWKKTEKEAAMDLNRIIGLFFTILFVLILFFIILRSLLLMGRDLKESNTPEEKVLRLQVTHTGENRNLKEGNVLKIIHETTFGRKNDNTVVLTDPYVSGYHFRIFPHEGRFVIEDNASTNGTVLNGDKLTMKTYLKSNDVIRVGNMTLKVSL